MFYMMFLVLGTPFKSLTKAWLFIQKCNPEKLLHVCIPTVFSIQDKPETPAFWFLLHIFIGG